MESIIQEIVLENDSVALYIKREDLLHPYVSGNKLRKLKYNLQAAKNQNKSTLLTFGGAFSNHIAATAFAGKQYGFRTIGVIRGEELKSQIDENPTLKFARQHGMIFEFVSRENYKLKDTVNFIDNLKDIFGDFYLLPEGGTNDLAVVGCEEILNENDDKFDYVCVSVGTGGTICGLINKAFNHQSILGFPALKGDFLQEVICQNTKKNNWKLVLDYHFGGYGKVNSELIDFINNFYKNTSIPLDAIYTGKLVYGVIDLINKNYFPKNSKILIIHTGGIQGIIGMNIRLRKKNLTTINI